MINTNTGAYLLSCTVSKLWLIIGQIFASETDCLTLTLSLRVTACAMNDISLKSRFFGLHFRCRKYWCICSHFYVIRPKATEFGVITRRLGLLRRSKSSKVTEFATNRQLICDFLLVINTNLAPISHRFRDIALGPKSLYSATPLEFNSLDGRVPLTISVKFYLDVNRWPAYQKA